MEIRRNGSRPSVRREAAQERSPGPGLRRARAAGCALACYFRARRPHRLAYPPARPDALHLSGLGRAQAWGGPIRELCLGDVIWFPPGEKHWHGGSPTVAMLHLAIQEALDGSSVDWRQPVDDADYGVEPAP
jgi:hypothetical protein